MAVIGAAGCSSDDERSADKDAGSGAGTGGAGAGGADTAGAGAGGVTAGPADDIDLYGSLNVTLEVAMAATMAAARTTVIGKIYDGPTPSPEVWATKTEANGCTLYVPNPVLCQPACGSAAACVKANTCTPYPKATSVGTITLTGLGSGSLTLDPVADNYQPKAGTNVPFPPCSEGTAIELAAAGGKHAAFKASAKCIPPLDFKGSYTLASGEPLKLTWGKPGQSDLAKIFVKIDVSHHGGTKGKIECEVADSGELEVPASLVDALVDLGVAGFPTVALTRRSSGAGSGKAKSMTLTIASPVELPLEIPGLKSCSGDTDCAASQTCQPDRTCK